MCPYAIVWHVNAELAVSSALKRDLIVALSPSRANRTSMLELETKAARPSLAFARSAVQPYITGLKAMTNTSWFLSEPLRTRRFPRHRSRFTRNDNTPG